jgi:hypothetical protein
MAAPAVPSNPFVEFRLPAAVATVATLVNETVGDVAQRRYTGNDVGNANTSADGDTGDNDGLTKAMDISVVFSMFFVLMVVTFSRCSLANPWFVSPLVWRYARVSRATMGRVKRINYGVSFMVARAAMAASHTTRELAATGVRRAA